MAPDSHCPRYDFRGGGSGRKTRPVPRRKRLKSSNNTRRVVWTETTSPSRATIRTLPATMIGTAAHHGAGSAMVTMAADRAAWARAKAPTRAKESVLTRSWIPDSSRCPMAVSAPSRFRWIRKEPSRYQSAPSVASQPSSGRKGRPIRPRYRIRNPRSRSSQSPQLAAPQGAQTGQQLTQGQKPHRKDQGYCEHRDRVLQGV